MRDPESPLAAPTAPAVVALEDVTVRYRDDEAPVLRGVDLRLDPGRKIALVGPSGAGKTTVTHLLFRFLDPEHGRVTIAGHDVRDHRQEDVRRMFALAGQGAHLFTSTIRQNLLLARPDRERRRAVGRPSPGAGRRLGRLAARRPRHLRRRGG